MPTVTPRADEFWRALREARASLPRFWAALDTAQNENAETVYSALSIARAVTDRDFGHIHAHFGGITTKVARLASAFSGIAYTFTMHAWDLFHESVDAEELSYKIRDASAVLTISDYNLRYLKARYPEASHKIRRIYNGLDLTRVLFEDPADRPPSIIAVGRLIEKKGFSDLVEACALLINRGVSFSCKIAGGGDLEQELRRQIRQRGLQMQVELLGPRPQREIVSLIRDATVLAAPCIVAKNGDRDGLPTVLLEAMAVGTPCVSTRLTGIPEVVRHRETGLLVAPHDRAALADALEQLLSDRALRASVATRARRLIETEFDVHRNAALLRAMFGATRSSPMETISAVC